MITKELFRYNSPDQSPGYQLWQVYMAWHRKVNKAMAPFQLTHAQFLLLSSLGHLQKKQSHINQVHLASHSKLDVMSTSKSIRLMEAKGLIIRTDDATDQRAKSLGLTEEGEKVLKKATKAMERMEMELFSALRKDKHIIRFSEYLDEILIKSADLESPDLPENE